MKKLKIGDIILWLFIVLFLLNTLAAYFSYVSVSDNKEPKINFGVKKENGITTYNEGLYNIVVKEDETTKEVSLKLFFLK